MASQKEMNEIKRFLRTWSKVILKEAERISIRDRGEVSIPDGKWLKEKFREASSLT